MYPRIKKVEHLDDYRLKLTFTNGESGVLDLANLIIASEGRFVPLQDVRYFAKAHIDPTGRTVVWPNGVALNPDMMYERTMSDQINLTLSLFATDPEVLRQQRINEAEREFAKMRRAAMQVFDNGDSDLCNTPEEMFDQVAVEYWRLTSKLKL
jgi:hypothetical protein